MAQLLLIIILTLGAGGNVAMPPVQEVRYEIS